METNQTQQKKLPKLTKQDEDFVEKVVITGKLTKSAQEAYKLDNQRYAGVKAQRMITKDNIINAIEIKRETLKSALEKEGITPTYIAQKVNVLLQAIDDKGKTDFTAVDKGLKHAKDIYGVEDSDKPKENVYNFFFDPKFQQNIKNYDQHLKEQILNKDVE